MKRTLFPFLLLVSCWKAEPVCETERARPAEAGTVRGVVFSDDDADGVRDASESGVAGVAVSNGRDVVVTDASGAYSVPALEEMVVFISKPRDYALPLSKDRVPRFYYVHRPNGSPAHIQQYEGLEPTGPLPDSIDFALIPEISPDRFRVLALGDTQVRTHDHVGFLRDSLLPSVAALTPQAHFAISMGDLVDNTLSLYPRYQEVMGAMGVATYYVPGNHDLNFDARTDRESLETYERFFGPPYYSFDFGQVHFVVLDSVAYEGGGKRNYHGEIEPMQLEWLRNDLAQVSPETLIVINMHIPLVCWLDRWKTDGQAMVCNRQSLYDVLKDRKVLALAGHMHTVEHYPAGHREERWGQPLPFPQIIVGAVCGSWWEGGGDARGIPFSYQRDGAPKGYFVIDFDGTQYHPRYRPTTFDDVGMHLSLTLEDGSVPAAGVVPAGARAEIVANVWGAPVDAEVWVELEGTRISTTRESDRVDPLAERKLEGLSSRLQMKGAVHVWVAPLGRVAPGLHRAVVHARDRYGNTWEEALYFEGASTNQSSSP